MTLAGLGIAIGLVGAGITSRALVTLLFGVTPLDSTTYADVATLFVIVSMPACALPPGAPREYVRRWRYDSNEFDSQRVMTKATK